MNKPFLALVFLVLGVYGTAQNLSKKESRMVFEIDFQDFFNSDTISLRVNDCINFKNIVLTSNKSTGLTDKIFKGYTYGKDQVIIFFKGSSNICNYSTNQIFLFISLNGEEKKYTIDIRKGSYLGFSKKGNDNLTFLQSITPFQYD
jgi:hypothetical protein